MDPEATAQVKGATPPRRNTSSAKLNEDPTAASKIRPLVSGRSGAEAPFADTISVSGGLLSVNPAASVMIGTAIAHACVDDRPSDRRPDA